MNIRVLGDVLGPLTYLGQCRPCGRQFMSTHDRVVVINGETICERCASRRHECRVCVGEISTEDYVAGLTICTDCARTGPEDSGQGDYPGLRSDGYDD